MAWISASLRFLQPSEGSWLDRRMTARGRHPDSFECGVRVLAGRLAGERPRWSFRSSALDPLVVDGVLTLHHGSTTLRLRADQLVEVTDGTAVRPFHRMLDGVELGSGARVRLSVADGNSYRFEGR